MTNSPTLPARCGIAAVAGAITLATLTGCGTDHHDSIAGSATQCTAPADQVTSVVIVASVHRGATAARLPAEWACTLKDALTRQIPISVVTSESVPQVALRQFTTAITTINPTAQHDDLVAAQNRVIGAVSAARASSEGDDLWAALTMAADLTRGNHSTILSLDNGLSDRGALTMTTPGMSSADPADVVAYLRRTNSCGNLTGSTVELVGIGYSTPPQPPLPEQQRTSIAEIWTAALRGCGARASTFATPPSGPAVDTSYTTTTVPVAAIPAFTVTTKPIVMDNASPLGFIADTATFRDPTRAAAVLTGLSDQLRRSPTITVTITGSTANAPTAWPSQQALGQARADACKKALERLGAPAAQIIAIGRGYLADPPGDTPAAAAQNRKILFTFDTQH